MSTQLLSAARRPLRLAGGALVSAVTHAAGYALLGVAVMLVMSSLLVALLPDAGALAVVGRWSLQLVFVAVGAICGALLGVNVAAAKTLAVFEDEMRVAFIAFTPRDTDRLVPSMPLAQLRISYDASLDSLVEQTLGRVRVPRFLRRFVRSRMRQQVVEQFIAECESRGRETVGFAEVRDWLIARGVPLALAPARAKVKLWRIVILAPPVLLIGATLVLILRAALATGG